MPRSLVLAAVAFASVSEAAIWPETFAGFSRLSVRQAPPAADRALWQEFGLEEAETAGYGPGGSLITGTAWRLRDATSAVAVFHWLRPPGARPWKLDKIVNGGLAAQAGASAMLAFGNYVLRFDGRRPADTEILELSAQLPRLDQSPLPPLLGYLPDAGLIPNSERYILGPASLEKFRPEVPPSTAAFRFGSEALLGRYRYPGGELDLALFYYPSPQIAIERTEAFRKLDRSMVKRSGPIVAVILSPGDPDFAERLLAQVSYKASISWSEATPRSSALELGSMLLSIFALCGVLILFCLLSGLAFGGFRFLVRRFQGGKEGEDPMIMLHLSDR